MAGALPAGEEREIVFVTKELNDGRMTVPVPWAPASFAGGVKIMGSARSEMPDAGLGEPCGVPGRWGAEARDRFGKTRGT